MHRFVNCEQNFGFPEKPEKEPYPHQKQQIRHISTLLLIFVRCFFVFVHFCAFFVKPTEITPILIRKNLIARKMHSARRKITKNYKFQVVKCTKHSGVKWAIFMESK